MLGSYTALDLTDLKGQFAGKLLADLGMRVIKVEPRDGDAVRRMGPFKADQPHREGSLRFAFLNGGKEIRAVITSVSQYDGLKRTVDVRLRMLQQPVVLLLGHNRRIMVVANLAGSSGH